MAMKNVWITMRLRVTDKFFEEELKEFKADIMSGKYQKEVKHHSRGEVKKITCTFEVINGK